MVSVWGRLQKGRGRFFRQLRGQKTVGRREGEEQDFLGRASVVLWHPEHLREEMEFQRVI